MRPHATASPLVPPVPPRANRGSTAAAASAFAALAALAPAATAYETVSPAAESPAWSEARHPLGRVRWWIDPAVSERLQRLRPQGLASPPVEWAVSPGDENGISDTERSALGEATAAALTRPTRPTSDARSTEPVGFEPSVPPPAVRAPTAADAADAEPEPFTLRARITEAWRPNRLLNLLILALPGPGAAFVTQGGAAAEIELFDASGRPVAGFACRQYAGILQFLNAFGRIGHARAALEDCAGRFLATLRDGRPPATLLSTAAGASGDPAQADASVAPLPN